MATDFSAEAAHARRQAFRAAVIVLLFGIALEILGVAYLVHQVAKQTEASPIERCIRDYGLTPEQCRVVEGMGLRVPLDGGK